MILSMRKRNMSPGRSMAGGFWVGSKNDISVRPMVFQPLGPAEAETPVCTPPIDTEPAAMLITGTWRRGVANRTSMPPR